MMFGGDHADRWEPSVHSRWLLTASNNMVDIAGEEFMKNITAGIEQDLDIWKHKVHRANPVFCEGDHYLGDYRKWARQFYTHPARRHRSQKGGELTDGSLPRHLFPMATPGRTRRSTATTSIRSSATPSTWPCRSRSG